jgi:hypothetical protein
MEWGKSVKERPETTSDEIEGIRGRRRNVVQ